MSCAAVGGTLIVCQFLLAVLGLGGHHDVGSGHDFDSGHDLAGHDAAGHGASDHHDASHEAESNWFLSMISFRTLTAAFAFFGLAGLASNELELELEPSVGLGISLSAGAAAFLSVGWMMRFFSRLNIDGTIRIDRAVGANGTVYLSIPGAKTGVGKVHVINRSTA